MVRTIHLETEVDLIIQKSSLKQDLRKVRPISFQVEGEAKMEKPVQTLERLLIERGIDPDVRGTDIGFLYMPGGHTFKGQAWADVKSASVEFWLRHFPRKDGGEVKLQAKLDEINKNEVMLDSGVRWMKFIFTKGHLGFVAQLNQRGKPLDEDTARQRLEGLMKLMESELPGLIT